MIKEIKGKYSEYLKDESSGEGFAESISFPGSEDDIKSILTQLLSPGCADITVQGARTGIKGLAVPRGGHIINMSGMNRIKESGQDSNGEYYILAESGVKLQDLSDEVARCFKAEKLYWPPSPSEGTATLGGIAATGAFGMNIAACGKTSDYISGITYFDRMGERKTASRPEELEKALRSDELLVITELRLRLVKRPENLWGAVFFFENESMAASCGDALCQYCSSEEIRPVSLEFIGKQAINMTEQASELISELQKVPAFPEGTEGLIYIELAGTEEENEEAVMGMAELAAEYGSDTDSAWALFSEAETEKMHIFRHAVTEAATMKMAEMHAADKSLRLISTDITIPDAEFSEGVSLISELCGSCGAVCPFCGCIPEKIYRLCFISADTAEMNECLSMLEELKTQFAEV